MGWQRLLCVLEVLGVDVRRPGITVAERLDQDVLRGIVQAPGPVEPQAARLGAGCPGELTGDLGPAAGVFRQVDPKVSALAILGAVNWTVKWFRPDGAKSARQIGREQAELLVRGVLAPGVEIELSADVTEDACTTS